MNHWNSILLSNIRSQPENLEFNKHLKIESFGTNATERDVLKVSDASHLSVSFTLVQIKTVILKNCFSRVLISLRKLQGHPERRKQQAGWSPDWKKRVGQWHRIWNQYWRNKDPSPQAPLVGGWTGGMASSSFCSVPQMWSSLRSFVLAEFLVLHEFYMKSDRVKSEAVRTQMSFIQNKKNPLQTGM